MGISTPKPRFDLAAFLAEPAPVRMRRKPTWQRTRPVTEDDVVQDTSAEDPQTP